MQDIMAFAVRFGIPSSNVDRWLKEEIDKVPLKPSKLLRENRKGQGQKATHVEENLHKWILEKREESFIPVSTTMIRMKALLLIRPHLSDFKASDGWLRRFLRRNNLVSRDRTSMAQALPSDLENKVAQFRQAVYEMRVNGDFEYDLIANMDETPVFFDMVPSKTVDTKRKKSIRVRTTKSEKQRIAAVISCTSSGKMLPPMVIFKGKTQRVIKDISNSHGAVVSFQKEGWMDEMQMIKWIDDV